MDYGMPERRKSKKDKKAKRRFRVYKKGGFHRTDGIKTKNKNDK